MKITLVKKNNASDKDPLIVQWISGAEATAVKKTMTVAIGETLEVDDDLAIELMQKYRGMFQMEGQAKLSAKATQYAAPKNKAHEAERNS